MGSGLPRPQGNVFLDLDASALECGHFMKIYQVVYFDFNTSVCILQLKKRKFSENQYGL